MVRPKRIELLRCWLPLGRLIYLRGPETPVSHVRVRSLALYERQKKDDQPC